MIDGWGGLIDGWLGGGREAVSQCGAATPAAPGPAPAAAAQVARLHHSLEEQVHANTQLLADNNQRQVRAGCTL